MFALRLRLSKWLNRIGGRGKNRGRTDDEDRRFGTSVELSERDAYLREHGCLLMLHRISVSGQEAYEEVPARFGAENGSPAAVLTVGRDRYLFRIDDLETALSDPVPMGREGSAFPPEGSLSRETCQEIQGGVLLIRAAEEIKDEELFEPAPARFLLNEIGMCELSIREEAYLFHDEDFWAALTDPLTYRSDDDGPFPIDILRGPLGPDMPQQRDG